MAWYRRWALPAGVALIVAINAVALGGAMYNRGGAADSTLALSLRELQVPYRSWREGDNSGLALRLTWQVEDTRATAAPEQWFPGEAPWLTVAKLTELGISVRAPTRSELEGRRYYRGPPTDVLLVLELNGPAYHRQVEWSCRPPPEAEPHNNAQASCEREKHQASRLFVVDAGHDRGALRRKYPDTSTYAIAHGRITTGYTGVPDAPRIVAGIGELAVDEIHVPAALGSGLKPAARGGSSLTGGQPPDGFAATVSYGRRLEPWLVGLTPVERH